MPLSFITEALHNLFQQLKKFFFLSKQSLHPEYALFYTNVYHLESLPDMLDYIKENLFFVLHQLHFKTHLWTPYQMETSIYFKIS